MPPWRAGGRRARSSASRRARAACRPGWGPAPERGKNLDRAKSTSTCDLVFYMCAYVCICVCVYTYIYIYIHLHLYNLSLSLSIYIYIPCTESEKRGTLRVGVGPVGGRVEADEVAAPRTT